MTKMRKKISTFLIVLGGILVPVLSEANLVIDGPRPVSYSLLRLILGGLIPALISFIATFIIWVATPLGWFFIGGVLLNLFVQARRVKIISWILQGLSFLASLFAVVVALFWFFIIEDEFDLPDIDGIAFLIGVLGAFSFILLLMGLGVLLEIFWKKKKEESSLSTK